jgi:hypothetical protein
MSELGSSKGDIGRRPNYVCFTRHPTTDIGGGGCDVRFVPIVLKKSFWGGERNFSEPLMRFARDDMRDHIVSHKNDHGPS